MFIFSDNEQLKKEFKKIVIDENLTMQEVAKRCDLSPQILQNRFSNSRVALTDLKKFLDAIGYELQIDFVKKWLMNNYAKSMNVYAVI